MTPIRAPKKKLVLKYVRTYTQTETTYVRTHKLKSLCDRRVVCVVLAYAELRCTLSALAFDYTFTGPIKNTSKIVKIMSSGRGYRRVQSEDSTASDRGRTRSERVTDKIYACKCNASYHLGIIQTHFASFPFIAAWVSVAVLVARWTNFFHVILYSDQVNRPILYLALACLATNTVLLLYLTVYLPKVIKLADSSAWEVYCPKVIPSMGLFAALAAILLIRATYPVWGFLAPLILGIEAMGALFATQFIPWF